MSSLLSYALKFIINLLVSATSLRWKVYVGQINNNTMQYSVVYTLHDKYIGIGQCSIE